MNVPLLDIAPQHNDIREEIIESVVRVIDSTRYIQGPEVESLEKEIAAYCGLEHAVGVSSGTDALLVAAMALDLGPGDLVLTTPFSFFATMGIVIRTGARPVFADIDPKSYNIDPDSISAVLEKDREHRIKAIIPVHLYGQCAEMQRITEIAQAYGVAVIEDAAQAIGAEFPMKQADGNIIWKKAGCAGVAGTFSFFPSKNLGGIGDGGMVVSTDSELSRKIALLRNHGAYPKYYHALVGGNFRLDPIQAAVLRIKLRHLDTWHQQRRENAARYGELFKSAGFLADDERLTVPAEIFASLKKSGDDTNGANHHIYNQYVVRVKQRDQLRKWLQERGIGSEIYYPLCLHQQQCLQNRDDIPSMKHAERAATEVLALPIYPGLTPAMQEYVVETIHAFYKQTK